MQGHIEIGIIPHDLRQEETVVQIADALDGLNSAVSHIFGCIDERLSENTKRLAGVKDRAVKLQGRLDHLRNNLSQKAVKLYSAAKYPSNHVYKEYPIAVRVPVRHEDKPPTVYKSSVPIAQELRLRDGLGDKSKSSRGNGDIDIKERLQFYHVKSKPEERNEARDSKKFMVGPAFVGSLLLDDGKDNRLKPLSKSLPPTNDKREIEDAPASILQSWHQTDLESPSNYFYAPTLGEVPQINVPLTLPDLPGIVDDERFILDLNSQSPIAPSSAVTTPTVNLNLPAAQLDSTVNGTLSSQNSGENGPSLPNSGLPNISAQRYPPPPPPAVEISVSSPPGPPPPPPPNPSISSTPASQPPPPPPPPPPPSPPPCPPPPPPASTEQSLPKKPVALETAQKSEPVDDRSSLMAAIRNAGGIGRAKLKSAAKKEEEKTDKSSAPVGGDLMADLHMKLKLRRKGISGALARMSEMISPPSKPDESGTSDRNSATNEQDSQADTDWDE